MNTLCCPSDKRSSEAESLVETSSSYISSGWIKFNEQIFDVKIHTLAEPTQIIYETIPKIDV